MKVYKYNNHRVWEGNCLDALPLITKESVHQIITSPPYWGQRDYETDSVDEIGSETTPELYVAKLVLVMRKARRVLREDGTLWVNLGDAYQDRQLLGIPWKVAFALQRDGWILRQYVPWVKRNAIPEGARNRPARALEDVFMFSKSPTGYYFDMDAVRQPSDMKMGWDAYQQAKNKTQQRGTPWEMNEGSDEGPKHGKTVRAVHPDGRNFRNVDLWFSSVDSPHGLVGIENELVGLDANTYSFKGSHFATFPPKLIEPLIKAGTSQKGVCSTCGAPMVRKTERKRTATRPGKDTKTTGKNGKQMGHRDPGRHVTEYITTGWEPSCSHSHFNPVPATVLDPFWGAGTVSLVCEQLGRKSIGVELNPVYIQTGLRRLQTRGKGIRREKALTTKEPEGFGFF